MTVIESLLNENTSFGMPYFSERYTIKLADKNNGRIFAKFSSRRTIPEGLRNLKVEWGPVISYINQEITIGI